MIDLVHFETPRALGPDQLHIPAVVESGEARQGKARFAASGPVRSCVA